MSSKKSGKARRIGSTRKDLRGLGSQMRDKEADVFATLLEESRTMEHESATTGGEPKPIEEGSRPMGVELWTTGGEPKPIEEGSRPMGEESRTTGKEPKSMEEKSMAIGVASWSTERNSRTTGEKQEVDFKPEESSLSERTASLLAPSHDPYSAGTPHLESNKMEKKKRMGSSRRKLPTDLEEHRREGWDGAEQEEWQEGGKHAVGDQAGSKTAQPFGELHTEPRKASECLEGREESAMTGNQHAFHILDMPAIENKSVDSQFYPQSMYSEEAQKNKQLHTTNESNLIINLDQSEGRLTNEDTHDRDLLQSTDSGQLGYADAALQLPKSEENTLHEDNKHEMAHFEHKKRKMGSTRKGGRALQIKSDREQEFDILAEEMLRSSGDLADVCVLQGKESQEKSRLDVIQYINMEQVKMEGLLEMEENKEVEALTGTDRDKEQEKHKSTRETNEKHTISGLLGTDMVEDILVEMERREIDRPRSTGIAEENVKPEVRETDVVTEIRAPGLGGTGMVDRETEETTGTRILEFNETHRLRETHILEDNVTQENQGRDGGQRDEAEKESVTDVILGANVMKYEGASNEKESTKEEEGDGAQAKKTGKNWRQAQVMQIDLNMSFSSEKYEQEVTASERERNSPLENPSVVESFSFQDGTKTFIPEEQVKFTPFEDLLESRKNSQFYTSTHMEAPFTEDENEKIFIAPQEWENLGKKNKTESTHGNATKNKMENRIKGAGDDRSVLEGIRTEKIDMKLEREEKEQEDSWAITEDLNTILRDTGVLKELDIQEGDKSVAEEKQTPLVVEEVKGEPEVNMVGGIKENKWKLAEEGDIKMKGTDIAMEESVAVSQEFSKTETTHCNKDDSSYIYDPFHNVSVDPRVSERAATNTLSLEMNQKSDESSQKESTHLQKRKKMGSSRKGGRGLHKETEKSKGFRNIDGLEVSEQQEEREEERATEVKQNVINVVMEMTKEETKISMVEATSKSKEEIKIANDNSGAEDFESQQSVTEDPTAAEKLATNVVKGFEQHEDYSDRASSRNEKKRKIGTSHRRGRERLKEKEIQEMAETEVETMAMDNKESATDEVIKSVQNEEREYGNEKAERKSGSDSDKSHTSMVIPNLQRPENSAITTQQECSESQDTLLPAARRRKMGSRRQGQDNLRKRDVGLEWSEGCTAEAHVNTAALLQRMQEVFHQPDVEEKGCITWENVQGLSHELGLSIEELHQVFQQLDGDQDGLVTHQDLTKSLVKYGYPAPKGRFFHPFVHKTESCKQEQYFQFKREYSGTHSLGTSGLQGKADFGVRPSINEKLLTGSGLGQADPHLREGQALWEKKGTQARSEDTGSMSKTQEREEAWENEEETDVAGSKEQEREEAGEKEEETDEAGSKEQEREEAGEKEGETDEAGSKEQEREEAGEKEEETDEAGSKEQEREEAGEKEGETDEAGSKEQEREEAGEKEEETNEAGSKEQETEEPETWHKNNESQNAESKSDDYKAEKEELLSTSHEPEDTHLMNEEGELLNKDQERKDTQFLNQDQQNEWSKELDEEQVSDEAEGLRKCQGSKEAEIMNEDQDSGKPGLLHKDRDRERAELANKNQDNDHIKVLNENEESIMVELLIKNQGSKQEELLSKEEKGVEAGFLSEEHDNKEQGNQDTYCEEVEPLNEHGESVVKDSNQDRAIGMFDVVYKGEGHEKANDPEAEISLIKEGMTINISGEMTHEKEIVMSVKQLVDNASSIQEERKQNGVDAELINKDQQNRKAELLSMYQESGEVKMMCKDQGKEEREILSRYNETVASHIMNMTQNGNEAQMLSKDQPSEEAEILNKHQDHDEAVIINLVQEGEEAEILDKDQDNGEIEDQESEETERLQDGDNEEAEKLDQENKEGEITHKDQVRDETALPSIDIESEEAEILNDNQEYKEVEILKKHQEGDEFDSLNTDRDDEETEIEERYLQGEEAMIIQEDQEYVEVVILGMDQDNEKVQLDKELESEGAEILNEEQDTAEVYIQHEDQNSNDAENLGKYLEREEADITYKDEQREVTDLLSADTLGEETEMPKKDQDNEEAEIMHKVPTRDETNLLSLETESEFLTKCKASEEIELLSKDQEREGAGLLNMGQDNMDTERLSKDQQSEMTELLILNQVSKKPEITNEDQECVEVKLLIQDQESEEAEVMNMDHDNMEVYLQNKDWNSDEIQIQSNNKEGEEAEILSKHQKGEDMGVLNEEQDAEEIVIQDRDLETEEAVIINLGQDFYEAELLNRDQMSEKVEIINQNQEGEEAEILDQDQDSEELEIWDKGPESEETERLNQDEEHVEVQLLKKDQDNQEAEMLDQEKKEAEIHKDQVREETDLVSIDMETEVQFIDKENEDAEILNDNQECVEVDMLNKDQDNEKAETLDKKLESEEAEIPNQVQESLEVYIQHEDQNSNDAENLGKYLEREEADITYKGEQREVTDLLNADTLGEETEMPKKDQDNEEAEIMHKVPARDETNLLSLETESEFLTKCKASEEIELLSKDQEREGAGLLNTGQDNRDTGRLSKDQQSEMTELLILNQVSKKPEITNEDQECVEVELLIQDQESEEAEVMNMDHDNMEVYLQNKDWNSDEIQIQSNNKEGEEADVLSKHQEGEDMGVLNEEQDGEEIVIQDRDLETEEALIINSGEDFYEAELLNRDQMSEKVEIINQDQEGEEAEILDQDQDSEELEIWDKGPESEDMERLNQDEEHVEVQLLKKDQDNKEAEMLDQEKKEAEIHKDQVREETDLVSIDMETEVQFIDKENEDAEILNDNQECVEVDMLNKDQDNEKAETLDKKLESEEAEIPNQVQESVEVYIQHEDQNSNDAENLGKYLEREEADITYKDEQREVTDLLSADTLGEETEMPKKDQDNEEAEIMHKVSARDATNLLSLETESEFLTKCKASEEIELLSKDQEREEAGLLNTGQDNMDTERLSKDQQSEMTELLNLNQVSKKPEITNEDQECVEVELLIQDQESEEAEAVNTDHDNVEVYLQNKDWNSDEIQIQSNNKEGEEAEILSKHQEGEDMGVLNEEQDGEEIVIQDRDLETEEAVIINSGQDFYEAVLLNRDQMSEKVEIINQDQEGEDAEILDQDQDSEELEIWDKGPESEETERLNQDEEHVEVQLLKKDQDNQEAEMLDQEKKEAEIHKDQVREETDLVCIDKESEVQIIDKENEDAEIVNHNQECVEVDMLNKDQDNEKTETLDKKLESEEAEIPNQVQESVEVYIQHEYQNSNDAENLGKYLEREEADITYKDEQREVTDLLSADTLGEETEMPKKDQDNEEAEIMHKVSARDATNLLSLETESEFLTKCKASEEIELLSKDQEREEAGLLNTGQDNVEVYLLNKDWNSNELQIQSNHKEIEEAEILSCHQEGEDVEVLNKKQDEEEIIIPHRDLETEEAGQGQDFVQIELLNMGQMSEKVEIISQNQEGEEAEMLDQDQEYVGVELPCTLKYGYKTHLRDAFDDLREVGGSENECDPHTSRAVVEDNEWIWDCELLKEQQFYSGCNEKKESWDIWDETNEAELGSTVYRERSDLGSQIDNVIFWQRWREDEFGRNNETSQILANDLYPIPEENETENNIEYNNVEIAQDIAKIQEMPQAADQSNTIIHFIIDNHKLKEIQEEKCILSEGDVTESDEQRDIVRLMELREKTEDSNTFENNKEHQDIGTIEGTTGSTMENRQCSATLANAVNQKDSNELSECVTLDGEKQEANAIKQSHDSVLVRSDVLGGANKDSSRVPEIPNNDDETICTGRRMAIQTGSTVHEMGAMRGRQAMAETAEGVEVIQNAEFQMDGDRIQMQGSCEKDRDNVIEHLQLSMESDTKWDGGTSQGRDTIAMEMKRKEKTQRQNNYEGAGFKKLSEVTTQEEIEHRGGTAGQHKGEGKDWDTSERGLAQGDTALKLSEKESLHADRGLEDYNNDRPHEKWDETPVFNQNHGFEELEQKISTDEKKLLAYQGDGLEMKTECLHVGLAQGTIKTKETEVGQQKDKGSDLTECEQASIGFSEDSESLIEKLNCNMNVMEWSVAEQGEKDNGRRDEACKDNNQLPTELVEHGKRGSDMKRVDYTSRSSNKQGLSLMQHVNSEDKDKQGVKKREQGAERHRMTPEEVCGEEELRMEAIRIYEKVEQEMSGDVMAEREVAAKEQKNREDKGKVGFRAMGGEIVVTPEDNGQLAIGCLPTGSWSPPISGPDLLYNVVLVGSSSVGKTSFMKRIQSGDFTLDHCATIGLDSCIQSLLVDGRRVLLQLWDTAGQERYHSITKQILRKAQGLLLMYDITCIDSFNSVQYWMSCIQEGATDDVIIMLLGNKNDTFKREVPLHEGEKLAKEYRVKFMECSVATGENVTLSMETLARMLKQQTDQKEEAPLILRKEQPKQKSGCC